MTTVRHLNKKGVRPEWRWHLSKGTISVTQRPGCLQRIAAVWHATINFLVPIGYEDESGFHYGEPPAASRRTTAC